MSTKKKKLVTRIILEWKYQDEVIGIPVEMRFGSREMFQRLVRSPKTRQNWEPRPTIALVVPPDVLVLTDADKQFLTDIGVAWEEKPSSGPEWIEVSKDTSPHEILLKWVAGELGTNLGNTVKPPPATRR